MIDLLAIISRLTIYSISCLLLLCLYQMWFVRNSKFGYYVVALILSLLILFFTGTSLSDLRLDGVTQFRKWLDVAGGVRLTYKVDMSKYREIYTNPQEFQLMRNSPDVFYEFSIKDNTVEKYILTQPETKVHKELIRQ